MRNNGQEMRNNEQDLEDLNALTSFDAIVEAGTLTAAAHRLGVSKATISRRLSALEGALGVTLLVRTTRRWSLTPEGRELHARIHTPLDALRAATKALHARFAEPSGLVRITTPAGGADSSLMDTLAECTRRYPLVQIELLPADSLVDLLGGGVDLALRTGQLEDSSIVGRRLPGHAWTLVASPACFEERAAPMSIEDLGDHELICDRAEAAPSLQSYAVGDRLAPPMAWRVAVRNARAKRRAALAGLGLATLPRGMVADDIDAGRLVELEIEGLHFPRKALTLLMPAGRASSAAVRAVADAIIEAHG